MTKAKQYKRYSSEFKREAMFGVQAGGDPASERRGRHGYGRVRGARDQHASVSPLAR
jgi:hypothetical protein